MKTTEQISYIVIGADHHTTLSVIRTLWKRKCNYTLIIHSKSSDAKLCKSRYGKNAILVGDTQHEILTALLKCKDNKTIFVVPASDLAALTIDRNIDLLKDGFIVPGFAGKNGQVALLMDKYQQKKFADKYDIPMAKTWSVKIDNPLEIVLPDDLVFPCIVKPQVSAFGEKTSIFIARDYDELNKGLQSLTGLVLIQQYLLKKYETCAYGVMVREEPHYRGGVIKKIHESSSGSTIFAECTDSDISVPLANRICDVLWREGYTGLYDFELLVCDDAVYLNEINFRNSGNGYALFDNRIPAPIIWSNSILGISNNSYNESLIPGMRHINDYYEVLNAKSLNISLMTALKNIAFTKSRAVLDFNDLSGTWAFYRPLIKSKIKSIFSKRRRNE